MKWVDRGGCEPEGSGRLDSIEWEERREEMNYERNGPQTDTPATIAPWTALPCILEHAGTSGRQEKTSRIETFKVAAMLLACLRLEAA
ncbi:hypothetical protein CERSUDRAFT_101404 [Gelatoporia subvermispora B]|uniref:Uncharacterized protein n=1 Tax=Ceriporiopsis subvermispora (strain B) TaxID=914234 RepID=M2QV93_CERS8|nr:hypothetical protein CERSUDRAFT_101404 [Gelatoporia subvermispora B]